MNENAVLNSDELKEILVKNPNVLLLDCRDAEEYNANKILTAINIPPELITQAAALVASKAKLDSLLTSFEDRIFFRQREFVKVVIYENSVPLLSEEEFSLNVDCLHTAQSSTVSNAVFLANILKLERVAKEIYILPGGFSEFSRLYPSYCSLGPVNNEDEDALKLRSLSLSERIKVAHCRLFKSFSRNIDCELPTKISSYLYLGSAQNSYNKQQLQQLNIRYVLNAAKECVNHYPSDFQYMKVSLVDDGDVEDASLFFESTFAFIQKAREMKTKVLVHCFMGMSRSAALVIAYYMRHKKWPLKKTYRYIKEKRPIVDVNAGFMYQLVEFEKTLFGKSSLPVTGSPILTSPVRPSVL